MSAPLAGQTAPFSTSFQQSYESSLSLPRFASVRNRAPSSEQGESSSPDDWRAQSTDKQDQASQHGSLEVIDAQEHSQGTPPEVKENDALRRHRPRHSGAFLLDPISTPSAKRHSHGSLSLKHKIHDKGKAKNEDGGLTIPKRRATHHHPRQSIGSSPLAGGDSNGHRVIAKRDGVDATTHSGLAEPLLSGINHSKDSKANANGENMKPVAAAQREQRASAPSIGFDTDPAQIVNLALNLSESRRRATSNRFVSEGRRIVSAGQISATSGEPQAPIRQGGSLREHLMQQRRMSRNLSPSSTPFRKTSMANPRTKGQVPRRTSRAVSKTVSEDVSDEEFDYEISEATAARAAKARLHFELFYEHRRLLSILPPIRKPHSGNLSGPEFDAWDSYEAGRAYNPLQYIRNRKLRWREKSPLWSEADGWNDVEKVRSWMDSVTSGHKESSQDPDECFRLPPLQDERNEPEEDSSPTSPLRRPATNSNQKPRRPRMDWITSPPDLLADAFWLEQGLNKMKIEDREGNRLYSKDIQLKFSGWKNRAPAMALSSNVSSAASSKEQLKTAPDLPTFRSHSHGDEGKPRGRRRQLRDSIHSLHSHSGSQDRPSLLRKTLTRSDSLSTESNSDDEEFRGRRRRKLQKAFDRGADGITSAALEKQMLDMLEQDAGNQKSSSAHHVKASRTSEDGLRASSHEPFDDANAGGVIFKSDLFKERNRSSISLDKPIARTASSPRSSSEHVRGRTSYEELDSTAPNSPVVGNGFVPSIAIKLSPPVSRSPSPTKKPLPARLFRHDRSKSKQRQGISAGDFGAGDLKEEERIGRSSVEAHRLPSVRNGTASPKAKRSSLTPEDESLVDLRRTQSAQVKGLKAIPPSDSRVRGMFKGGRIAELVGNEVSRVGDFIWKREVPRHARLPSSASSMVSDDSGTENENGPATPKANLQRYSTIDDGGAVSRKSTSQEPSRYNYSNLPIFRSPFNKMASNDDVFKTPLGSPQHDHISRQASAQREQSRHGRFERLAPPKISVRGVSPGTAREFQISRSPSRERRDSYGFGKAMNGSGNRVRNANQRLNDAIGDQPNLFDRPPVTGLAALDVAKGPRSRRPTMPDKPEWSISQRSISTSREAPTNKRDIARVRALLLSTGVKAAEICRRAHLVRDPPPGFLLRLATIENLPPNIQRREEHVVAARILVRNIDSSHEELNSTVEKFSSEVVPSLHNRLRDLDALVSENLIHRARSAVDDAGAQSTQLTTTRTLAVKQLNDGIDMVIRSRRRRFRWVRRTGFVMLEWTLLGLMWIAWSFFMVIKLVKGTVAAIVGTVRWLLFL